MAAAAPALTGKQFSLNFAQTKNQARYQPWPRGHPRAVSGAEIGLAPLQKKHINMPITPQKSAYARAVRDFQKANPIELGALPKC